MPNRLFEKLEAIATLYFDGHYAIIKYTTNYIVTFANITWLEYEDYQNLPHGTTLEEAIRNCIRQFEYETGNTFLQKGE